MDNRDGDKHDKNWDDDRDHDSRRGNDFKLDLDTDSSLRGNGASVRLNGSAGLHLQGDNDGDDD